VNAYDWHAMRGDPYLSRLAYFGARRPKVKVRGQDFAGVVEAVGRKVRGFTPGEEVFGWSDGAFAEYMVVPERVVARKPSNLTFEEAAALPLAGVTALMGVRETGGLGLGQRVLINGASGGVGTFAIQIARSLGAEVTAVCSTRHRELVTSLGAGRVVDYTREDFAASAERYDLVLDLVGNRSLRDCLRMVESTGTLVLAGGGVSTGGTLFGPMGLVIRGHLMAPFVRRRLVVLEAKASTEVLDALRELAESKALTPVIDRTYSLSEAAEAIRYLEVEHARAKVVVTV
jgi:NADPH:quinone reductase-like Zn-dependent oxidoreductase